MIVNEGAQPDLPQATTTPQSRLAALVPRRNDPPTEPSNQLAAASTANNPPIPRLMLHLASFSSQSSAERAWTIIVSENAEGLDGLSRVVRRTDLGEKGIFYRVLASGIDTRDEGRTRCASLERNEQYCRVMTIQ